MIGGCVFKMRELLILEDLTKEQLISLIEENREEINNTAIEIHELTEQISENHRNKLLITNQCMKLQKICKHLGKYYID